MHGTDDISLFNEFWSVIGRNFGIKANPSKNSMILDLVIDRMEVYLYTTAEDYIESFAAGNLPESELDYWASELTVNETYFFRNSSDWNAIRDYILPDIIERRRSKQTIRAISLGASSGEEAYTLALLLAAEFPELSRWNISIEGVDIHQPLLERARKGGPYSNRSVQHVPEAIQAGYLRGSETGWFVNDEIRSMVQFYPLNLFLLPANLALEHYDLIICRNVLIYFDQNDAVDLAKRVFQHTINGGYLILGHSEGIIAEGAALPHCPLNGSLIYRKTLGGTPPPSFLKQKMLYDEPVLPSESESEERSAKWLSTDDHVAAAEKAIDHGDLLLAQSELRTILMREPMHIRAHYLLGVIFQYMGNLFQAIEEFEQVIQLKPDCAMGFFQAAMLYQRTNEFERARKYYLVLKYLLQAEPPDAVLEFSAGITAGFVYLVCVKFLEQKGE